MALQRLHIRIPTQYRNFTDCAGIASCTFSLSDTPNKKRPLGFLPRITSHLLHVLFSLADDYSVALDRVEKRL